MGAIWMVSGQENMETTKHMSNEIQILVFYFSNVRYIMLTYEDSMCTHVLLADWNGMH
jgi:hypothetical protein